MFESFKNAMNDRQAVKNLITDHAIEWFLTNDDDVVVDELPTMTMMLANSFRNTGNDHIAEMIDLGARNFPGITWTSMATEIAKRTGRKRIFKDGELMWLAEHDPSDEPESVKDKDLKPGEAKDDIKVVLAMWGIVIVLLIGVLINA